MLCRLALSFSRPVAVGSFMNGLLYFGCVSRVIEELLVQFWGIKLGWRYVCIGILVLLWLHGHGAGVVVYLIMGGAIMTP